MAYSYIPKSYNDIYQDAQITNFNTSGSQTEEERSLLDRLFSMISNESVTSALYNATDGDSETTITGGLGAGVAKMNPFDNDVSDAHTFSDVLSDNVGWNPEGALGKAAKFTVGLAGDILLDPTTYLTFGLGAIPKILAGTGTKIAGKAAISAGEKTAVKIASESGERVIKNSVDDVSKKVGEFLKGGVKNTSDIAKNISNVKLLSVADARHSIDNLAMNTGRRASFVPDDELLAKGISADEQYESVLSKEAQALASEINKKVLHALDDFALGNEKGLEFGFSQIPFSSKIKIGDRQLSTFTKQLVSSETLRKLGDSTVAPYYNRLLTNIRNTKTAQKFSKYSAVTGKLNTQGTQAASNLYLLNKVVNGGNYLKAGKNAQTLKNYDDLTGLLDDVDETKRIEILNSLENGDMKDAYELHKLNLRTKKKAAKASGDDAAFKAITKEEKEYDEFLSIVTDRTRYKMSYISDNYLDEMQRRIDELDEAIKLNKTPEEIEKAQKSVDSFREQMRSSYELNASTGKTFGRLISEPRTQDEIAYLQSLANDEKTMEIADFWYKKMDEIAQSEMAAGKLSPDAYKLRKGSYVPHVLTDEAKEAFAKNIDVNNLPEGYNPTFAKKATGFSRQRTLDENITDINAASNEGKMFFDEDGVVVSKLFKDSLNEIYLTRALASNEVLTSHGVQRFIKQNVLKHRPDKYATREIVEYNDVMDSVNKFIGSISKQHNITLNANEFQAVKKAVLDDAGFKDFSSNLPLKEADDTIKKFVGSMKHSDDYRFALYNNVLDKMAKAKQFKYVPKADNKFINGLSIDTPLRIYYTDDYVLKTTNVLSYAQRQEQTRETVAFLDVLTSKFKKFKTLYNPGFIPQNVVGNMYNSWLGNAATLENPSMLKKAFDVIRTKDPKATITLNGTKYSYKQLYDTADAYGIMQHTFTGELNEGGTLTDAFKNLIKKDKNIPDDVPFPNSSSNETVESATMTAKEIQSEMDDMFDQMLERNMEFLETGLPYDAYSDNILSDKYNKLNDRLFELNHAEPVKEVKETNLTKTLNNVQKDTVTKESSKFSKNLKGFENKMVNASAATESHARLALFMNELNSGKSFEEAADSVKEFLFEYNDLTDFEMNVMKRIIPFYSWMKKNSMLQLEQLFEQSYKFSYTDKALNSADETLSGDEYDRYDSEGLIGIGNDFGVTPALPMYQFDKVNTPSDIFNQTNPMLKLPIEVVTGKNAYGKDADIPSELLNAISPQILADIIKSGQYDDKQLAYLLTKWSGNGARIDY